MTKKQRADVIELLRCAADCAALERGHVWLDVIAHSLDLDEATLEMARDVAEFVMDEEPYYTERITYQGDVMPNEWGMRVSLEAARLIEEGWTVVP